MSINKKIVETKNAPSAIGAYSQAVIVENSMHCVYISGQIPLNPVSMQVVSHEFSEQAQQVFKNLSAVAQAAGGTLADAVKLTVYLTDLERFAELNQIMSQYFEQPYPARAAIQVSALPRQVQIEIDAILTM